VIWKSLYGGWAPLKGSFNWL